MNVQENLLMGAFTVKDRFGGFQPTRKGMNLFSFLKGRMHEKAGIYLVDSKRYWRLDAP